MLKVETEQKYLIFFTYYTGFSSANIQASFRLDIL